MADRPGRLGGVGRPQREPDWLSIPDALDRILGAVPLMSAESVPILESLGRTLAEPVVSTIDQPPWDNSAMDGFAVRAEDILGATADAPVRLRVLEEVPAGEFASHVVTPGTAIRIMTGAPMPAGADSVVRLEHTDAWQPGPRGEAGSGPGPTAGFAGAGPGAAAGVRADAAGPGLGGADSVLILRDSDAHRNVRARGEDLRAGDRVLEAGRVVRPAEMGVMATVGYADVAVRRRPRIGILANGDELVDLADFEQVERGRRIVNSNSYGLAGAVRATGGEPVLLGIAADDEASIRAHLERARGLDALISTAGASVGDHDLLKDVLEEIGFELDFWRVRMRPGSPVSFGRLGGMPVFGLPGNPVSALVTFEVLVRPAIRRMLGRPDVYPPTIVVRVAERIASNPDLTLFLRVRLARGEDGGWSARLTGPQGSGILTSVTAADALLIVPAGATPIEAGEAARAIPIGAGDPARVALEF